MTRTQLALRAGIASIALTALGLAAATPASAHTNNMYTYFPFVSSLDDGSFATMGKADGVFSLLPNGAPTVEMMGIEVAGEKGAAIFYNDGQYVASWDHTTGVLGAQISAYIPDDGEIEFELDQFWGLDTTNEGTTITVVEFDGGGLGSDSFFIASVDVGTGVLTPLVDLNDALKFEGTVQYDIGGLATDPVGGTTYVFLYNEADEPFYLPVNVAAGTVGSPTLFQGAGFEEGIVYAADFDADGTLYFIYHDLFDSTDLELSKLGAPADWASAERQFISLAPAQYEEVATGEYALTLEHTALAATGAELPIAAFVILGAVAVLAGGVTVMVARRRAERGTV